MNRLRFKRDVVLAKRFIQFPYYVLRTETPDCVSDEVLQTLVTQITRLASKTVPDEEFVDVPERFQYGNDRAQAYLPLNRYDPWGLRTDKNVSFIVYRLAFMTLWMHKHRLAAATDGFGDIMHELKQLPLPVTYENLVTAVAAPLLTLLGMIHGGFNPSPVVISIGTLCLKHQISLAPFYAALNSIVPTPLLAKRARVAVCLPYLADMLPYFIERMRSNVAAMVAHCPDIEFVVEYCTDRMPKEPNDYTPWSRVARVRNLMVSRLDLRTLDYLLWVDADLVSYPPDFPRRALTYNPNNITAPVVLVENSTSFYDWCGFIPAGKTTMEHNRRWANDIAYTRGRNIGVQPGTNVIPYLPNDAAYKPHMHPTIPFLVGLDCCGAMYIMPTNILMREHTDATYDALCKIMAPHKLTPTRQVRFEDHPCFTDHFPVCQSHRDYGGSIYMDLGSVSMHANLPIYGIPWAGPGPR
jgi:hypothetical protein